MDQDSSNDGENKLNAGYILKEVPTNLHRLKRKHERKREVKKDHGDIGLRN